MFTGEYHHAVDGKGRVAVPSRFRDQLMPAAYVSKWIDGCLALFPKAAFEELGAKAATLPVGDRNARAFSRFLFATAFDVQLDGQNRFVVPQILREFAGLGSEAVVVGARDHLEIWEPEAWKAVSSRMDQPEVLAQHLEELGI